MFVRVVALALLMCVASLTSAPGQAVTLKSNAVAVTGKIPASGNPGVTIQWFRSTPSGTYNSGPTSTAAHQIAIDTGTGSTVATFNAYVPTQPPIVFASHISVPNVVPKPASAANAAWAFLTGNGWQWSVTTPPGSGSGATARAMRAQLQESNGGTPPTFSTVTTAVVTLP
jgi:hypothetical protein